MADLTDLKRAYLLGIYDGYHLARAQTQDEAEDLIAGIKASMDARLRNVRAEFDRQCKLDSTAEGDTRDPPPRLN